LEATNGALRAKFDCAAEGFATRQRRCVSYLGLQGGLANLRRVVNGLTTFGGVNDQLNLAVLDGINNVRPAFTNLVDPLNLDTLGFQGLGCTGSGDNPEAGINQVAGNLGRPRLVDVTNRHKGHTLGRQALTRGQDRKSTRLNSSHVRIS